MKYSLNRTFRELRSMIIENQVHEFGDEIREPLSKVLGVGRAAGADYVELFLEKRNAQTIAVQNGVIAGVSPALDIGVGIKVSAKGKNGYACTTSITFASILNCLEKSLSIIGLDLPSGSKLVPDVNLEPLRDYVSLKNKQVLVTSLPSIEEYKDVLLKTSECMRKHIAHLQTEVINASHDTGEVLVVSSDGVFARDIRINNRLALNSLAIKGDDRTTISRTKGATSLPRLLSEFDIEQTVDSMAISSANMLTADYVESGDYPVVLGNAFGGVIFHEACGHLLETTAVEKKSSPFSDMKGEMIAHEAVTAWDEGNSENAYGSLDMDDEGMPTQKTLLIENGVLKNFMSDRSGSLKTGHPRTASARRQNFRYAPASRMRNTWIAPGEHSKEDIIGSIENGIYCQALGGGSVQPTGDFNFAAQEAWKIEGGKLTKPLKGATLVGSAKDVLKKISMCGKDLELASGFCGSVSGRVYVTVGQPHLKVDSITVGGR